MAALPKTRFINITVEDYHIEYYAHLTRHQDDVADTIESLRSYGYKVSFSGKSDSSGESVTLSILPDEQKETLVFSQWSSNLQKALLKAALIADLAVEYGTVELAAAEIKRSGKERDAFVIEFLRKRQDEALKPK